MIYGGDITKSILSRLEVLEKIQAEYEEEKRIEEIRHAPIVILKPWSILEDEYILNFYPEGYHSSKPEELDKVTWQTIGAWVMSHDGNMSCQISMGVCLEWLYVFHRFNEQSKKYTQVQIDRVSEKWLSDYPKLFALHYSKGGNEMIETLCKFPQSSMIKLGALQRVFRGECIE